ncbi:hypothetical protein [Marinospirillum sp.]|nr:hypothetical protein [Marinospirillum sp.]
MAIPNTTGMQRKPTDPGEMLREDSERPRAVLSVLKWRFGLPV